MPGCEMRPERRKRRENRNASTGVRADAGLSGAGSVVGPPDTNVTRQNKLPNYSFHLPTEIVPRLRYKRIGDILCVRIISAGLLRRCKDPARVPKLGKILRKSERSRAADRVLRRKVVSENQYQMLGHGVRNSEAWPKKNSRNAARHRGAA